MNSIQNNCFFQNMTRRSFLFHLLCALCMFGIQFLCFYQKLCSVFTLPETKRLYMYALVALSFLFGILFYFLLLRSIYLIISKNKTFSSYTKYFLFYFGIMLIFWLLCWPGIFKGDEFYVLRSALSFELSPAQTGLTSCFYIVCLLFCPTLASIVFIQLIIISVIFAYIFKNLNDIYQSKKVWIMLPFFFLLPIIDGNLFTLRSSLVGWLFLFVLFKVFFAYKRAALSFSNFILIHSISGLICAWRTEYIYLVICLPVTIWLLKLIRPKKLFAGIILVFIFFCIFQIPNKIAANGSNKYPISLVLNPVANLFTEEHLNGPQVYEDIVTINELVDVQRLRLDASVRNISQYWNIPDILPQETLQRFMLASARLIVYNFDDFLKYRFETFAYTNGIYPNYINHPGGEMVSGILELKYYDTDFKQIFTAVNPPFGQALREKTIEFLSCRHYVQGNCTTSPALIVFYNCIPPIILLVLFTIAALVLRKKEYVLLSLLIQIQLILIFLTAPAMFFMYYYCFYLCAYVFIGLFLLDFKGGTYIKAD